MQIVTATAAKVPVICKDYYKRRSTEPKLQHPTNPDLLRQFTPEEHADLKAIPRYLVAGECLTVQHQILGQSVIYPAFVAVGMHIALCLRGVRRSVEQIIDAAETAVEEIGVAVTAATGQRAALQLALF
jgi:DNA (cytosine-5)-methyltransferase 1